MLASTSIALKFHFSQETLCPSHQNKTIHFLWNEDLCFKIQPFGLVILNPSLLAKKNNRGCKTYDMETFIFL